MRIVTLRLPASFLVHYLVATALFTYNVFVRVYTQGQVGPKCVRLLISCVSTTYCTSCMQITSCGCLRRFFRTISVPLPLHCPSAQNFFNLIKMKNCMHAMQIVSCGSLTRCFRTDSVTLHSRVSSALLTPAVLKLKFTLSNKFDPSIGRRSQCGGCLSRCFRTAPPPNLIFHLLLKITPMHAARILQLSASVF